MPHTFIQKNKSSVSKMSKKPAAKPKSTQAQTDRTTLLALSNTQLFSELPNTRVTAKHVLFYHGILSNWYTESPPFLGARALSICANDIQELLLVEQSNSQLKFDSFATWLLCLNQYNCGEQWMMAMKAWIFEFNSEAAIETAKQLQPSLEAAENNSNESERNEKSQGEKVNFETLWPLSATSAYQKLKSQIFDQSTAASSPSEQQLIQKWRSTSLVQILSSRSPKVQKAVGRSIPNFDSSLWDKYSIPTVIAGCVARAEVDLLMKRVYLNSGVRGFAEGAPRDTIWGTGRGYLSDAGDDETDWRGENRLGNCHNAARNIIVQDHEVRETM